MTCSIDAKNVIEKFVELKNQSLENNKIIETLKNIKVSNEIILNKLNNIIADKDLKNNFNSLIDIYIKDRSNYTNLNKQLNIININEKEDKNKMNLVFINNPHQIIKVTQNNK